VNGPGAGGAAAAAADPVSRRVEKLLGRTVTGVHPVGGGSICPAHRVLLDDGEAVFAKTLPTRPEGPTAGQSAPGQSTPGLFAAEAAGLRWLGAAGAVPVPRVLGASDDLLLLAWVPPGSPTAAGAEGFGRGLAALHRAGADRFGAGWPGYIGSLPLDNTPATDWPEFYATRRLLPYLRAAADRGALSPAQRRQTERALGRVAETAGPPEPPSRIHGDLWSGNVLWDPGGSAWLVDPAAHGGHRETDLAMLALFGNPYLDRTLAAYDEEFPLADGWRRRVPLHQLHPLLVHAALFGGGYGAQAAAAAAAC
jgi:fructosamine-3-kinase